MSAQRYLIVIEGDGSTNYSAYSPDIPGCVATGETRDKCVQNMREAITFHIECLRKDNDPVPIPTSTSSYVEVEARVA